MFISTTSERAFQMRPPRQQRAGDDGPTPEEDGGDSVGFAVPDGFDADGHVRPFEGT